MRVASANVTVASVIRVEGGFPVLQLRGRRSNQSPCAAGWTTVASYHTHGATDPHYNSEIFSNVLQPNGTYAGDNTLKKDPR